MSADIEAFDRALHVALASSVQMAQRLLAFVKSEIAAGKLSRDEAHARLELLYDQYVERGTVDEREAVADVLDAFEGWSPIRATI